jgi:hypothetical protein
LPAIAGGYHLLPHEKKDSGNPSGNTRLYIFRLITPGNFRSDIPPYAAAIL